MVEVEIRGKKFPLCLTVAALDQINAKCGGMKGISAFLDGADQIFQISPQRSTPDEDGNAGKAICNTAWMLALLIREGEENRFACARFDGEQAERRAVPDLDTINHLLTVASVNKYRLAVIQAVNESMKQEVEALYPKNVKDAEQG